MKCQEPGCGQDICEVHHAVIAHYRMKHPGVKPPIRFVDRTVGKATEKDIDLYTAERSVEYNLRRVRSNTKGYQHLRSTRSTERMLPDDENSSGGGSGK